MKHPHQGQGQVTGQEWGPREIKRLWGQEARPCKSHLYLEKMGIGDPGGVLIPMRTVRQRFRWKSLLRDLPDARPTRPKYFTKSLTSRATSVPLRLLTHTVIVPSISAPNVSEIERAEPGEEPRKAGRPAEAVERAAEGPRSCCGYCAGEGHRRGEPGGSGRAAGSWSGGGACSWTGASRA